ncbi:unnamed protein product, partial [Acanthocheilonema viteae]
THGSKTALEIRKNLYLDNIILPTKGTQEALKNYEEMKSIFEEASMNVREFLSNDNEFNKIILENDRAEKWPTHVQELPPFIIHPSEKMQLHIFTDVSNVAIQQPWRIALDSESHSRLLPKFVQNRVEEVRELKALFRYIPSKNNPVDIEQQRLKKKYGIGICATMKMTATENPGVVWIIQEHMDAKPLRLPVMPNLPETRIKRPRTLENIGFDYLGPVAIKTERGLTKRWITMLHRANSRKTRFPKNCRREPHEDEVVLVNEPVVSCGMWKLARIKGIKGRKDGGIRNAIIEIPHEKFLKRPVNVFSPLEVDNNENRTVQSSSLEEPIQETTIQEEPVASRTRSARKQQQNSNCSQ